MRLLSGMAKGCLKHWKTTMVALVIAGLILSVEGIVRSDGFWIMDQRSTTGEVSRVAELALKRSPNPEIVFMGSSRFKYGISPLVVGEQLNLPSTDLAVISFNWGKPMDYLYLYRKHRETFRQSRVIVVGVGERDFNWSAEWEETKPRFRQQASLTDRLNVPGQDKPDMIAGWFSKIWDSRALIREYTASYAKGETGSFQQDNLPSDNLDRAVGNRRSWTIYTRDSIPRNYQPEGYPNYIGFKDFNFSEVQLNKLVELVDLAREDGVQVVLLEMPMSPGTIREIATNFAAEDALWRERVESATGLQIVSPPLDENACSDWKECYFDYGHMSALGAKTFSKTLGGWLNEQSIRSAQTR